MTQTESQNTHDPPTPDGLPLIGNVVGLAKEPFDAFPRWQEKHGDAVRTQLVNDTYYIFYHPDHVRQVLVEDDLSFSKGELQRALFEPLTGTPSVALSTGEEWQTQRQGLHAAFDEDKLDDYLDVVADRTNAWVESHADGDTVEIKEEMRSLSLEILGEVFLGVDLTDSDNSFRRAGAATSEKYDGSLSNTLLPNWVPTPTNRRFARSTDEAADAMRSLIRRRDPAEGDSDALSELLAQNARSDGPSLSEEVIHNNLVGFLLAGHQTLGIALTYVWYLLARHPSVTEQVRDEVERELEGERPTRDELKHLDYVNAAITEAFRYYPPVHCILRETEEDTTVGGYNVPKGSGVVLPQFVIHRDERWFDDPDRFVPKRWLGDGRERPDFAYFPFGGGPHLCYGRRLSLTHVKMIVATIARCVEFEAETHSFGLSSSITAQPDEEIELTVKRL